jgi:hypothetical protein
MSNSNLISGTLLTNNCTSPRYHAIDTITPHYMAWFTDAKTCCESFLPRSRMASANYCIGKDGEIWLNVEEKNRAWTTGNSHNDNRAITIECANYTDSSRYGHLPDATWNALVALCVDICKRNGKDKLVYTGYKSWEILSSTEMLLTKHKWFQDTDCPGPWLDGKFGLLANEVNAFLHGKTPQPDPPSVFGGVYKCMVDGLNVRDAPNLSSNIIATYSRGQLVELDDWYTINDGYVWGRYVGASSGLMRYVAVGRNTGKVESDDFLIKL